MKTEAGNLSSGKQVMKGGLWTFSGKIVFALSAFIINVMLSRMLDTREYGTYFLVFNLILFGSTVGVMGLNQSIIRFTAENINRKQYHAVRKAIRLTLRFAFLGAVGVTGLYLLVQQTALSRFMDNDIFQSHSLAISMWMFGYIFQILLAETFRGLYDTVLAAWFGGVLSNILVIAFLVLAAFTGQEVSLSIVVLMLLAAIWSSNAAAGWCLWRKLKKLPATGSLEPQESRIGWRTIASVSLPIMWSNVSLFFLTATDLWILGLFRNEEEVAIYGAAVRFIAIINLFVIVLNSVMSTFISDRYTAGKLRELERIGRWVTVSLALPGIVLWSTFVLYGEPILGFVFGEIFTQAGTILIFLSAGQLMNLLMGPVGLTLMLTGNERRMLRITLFCSVVTFAGACWMAKAYGGLGVAQAMFAGLLLQNVLMWYTVKKKLGISLHFSLSSLVSLIGLISRCMVEARAASKKLKV